MTADHERARTVRAMKLPVDAATLDTLFPDPWHSYGLLGQIVFFLLTVAGIAAFHLLTKAELLTAVLCIVGAEFLIRGRRWFGTGVEAALWIGGCFSAISALPNTGAPEASLLLAAGAALSGWRVRNPLFGALAAFFVTYYLETKADLGTLGAMLLAFGALAALHRVWRRPSTEWLFIVLLLTMPFAAWSHADPQWSSLTIAMSAALAVASFVSAIRRRDHAMFGGAAAAAIVAGGELLSRLELSEELVCLLSGAFLMLASVATARALRGRTQGFVTTPAALTPFDDDLEHVATFASQPSTSNSAGNPPASRAEGGGGFGGAGATGDY